jgi:5-methylcytosine-specific restriction endonuclease McrA
MVATKHKSKHRKKLRGFCANADLGLRPRPALRNRRILVINRNYQPITTTTLEKAVNKIFKEIAVVVLPPGKQSDVWQELTWDMWADLKPCKGESVLKGVERVFTIPEIIKIKDFGEVPQRQVKLSRRAIFKRDDYTCQYCGKQAPYGIPMDELSIDHVLPKSQGGKTLWDNVVLACVKCNRKKDNKTPEQARMILRKGPVMPNYDILQGRLIRVDSWQNFLGDCYWEVPLKD